LKNNNSEVVVNKNEEEDNNELVRMFKRPSLTVKSSYKNKSKVKAKHSYFKARTQIESWFVHK
jgi:hypothetical protein